MSEQTTEHLDHETHFSWLHDNMYPLYGIGLTLIATLIVVWWKRRKWNT